MATEFFVNIESTSDAKVIVISVAARMAGMHPQTLRQYDRLGLVQPGRTAGGGRRYSARDVALLREIQRLSQEEGVNLAGIKRIIELEQATRLMQSRVAELEEQLLEARRQLAELHAMTPSYGRDLVPTQETALVVWRPRNSQQRRRDR
ncbi:helix-turn-helix transcriptional regulator [Actinocatenispora sera]|jgi:MerR family transcriptional regulator/heat shock protein HspR|uniref:Putative heat shock protein HspR n=1 Tax=Actinocatenispora sera TaxID=390989 RepID=A0A810KUD8_9ACTN|nr:helix-turn-helix transcriptional regulator [Actinocatenispora sera]BCJ26853.1 putative heat shock protein HspR [Actinocatenispora sera]